MLARHAHIQIGVLLLVLSVSAVSAQDAGNAEEPLIAFLSQRCAKCHGGKEVNGKVDLKRIASVEQLRAEPELVHRVIEVLDANDMPPEGEPELDDRTRKEQLANLRTVLRTATVGSSSPRMPIRRLNRFQYNNTVKDLFQLKLDIFPLPEKLMTRYDNYIPAESGRMPDKVQVVSHALNPQAGLRDVKSYPKDLRAEHGFDNQANQLTLSPLLLDSFLQLSVSIVESPDFNEQNVGIWSECFLEPPEGTDLRAEISRRLEPFLRRAFRGPVDAETHDRYVAYGLMKITQGSSFTESMKKVASAVLSSPRFLYRSAAADGDEQFELASNLSYFLWGSCPDRELLELAERGALAQPDVLNRTIERMLADPKIERFLDSFPSQWLQLENVLAATPDPRLARYFALDQGNPASLQMVLEPLLLFDAVFIEDRPIIELIAPAFGYRSEFLETWYTTALEPPTVNTSLILEENRRNDLRRKDQQAVIANALAELDALIQPVRVKLLAERQKDASAAPPVDLKPYAAWEFNGDLKESLHGLDLQAFGDIKFKDGMVVLDRAYLLSKSLPIPLREKTLEVWFQLHKLDERGGGLMGIQGPGDFFDSIVLGERQPRHWISGSDGFKRTLDFPESMPETEIRQVLQLAMVYAKDGTTTLYRNGRPYGQPFLKDSVKFPAGQTAVIFGLRHLPPGGNRFLTVSIDKARLYKRALTAEEVAASARDGASYVTDEQLLSAMTFEQRERHQSLRNMLDQQYAALDQIPPSVDPEMAQQKVTQEYEAELRGQLRSRLFERVAVADRRYGGVITNAALLSMTSGPKRTHPIARGAWIIEAIFNDPPPPPPNDVPPLNEEESTKELTIREKFAAHRENPSCAGCHSRIDPLGFALENFDITGRWRDKYDNGKPIDASGLLLRKHAFDGIVGFKSALVEEKRRFARAFTGHLLRFAIAQKLQPTDWLAVDAIVDRTETENFKLKSLLREVAALAK